MMRIILHCGYLFSFDFPGGGKEVWRGWLNILKLRLTQPALAWRNLTIGTSSQRSSWSLSRQLTGTTTVDCYFHHSFLPTLSHHFSVTTFSHRKVPRIKKVIQQKLMGAPQTQGGRPLSRPRRPFWGPLAAILEFWGTHRMNDWIITLI